MCSQSSSQIFEHTIPSVSARITPPPLPPKKEFKAEFPKRFIENKTAQIGQESEFERSAREIFAKIWSWIAVGEEYRPRNVSLEYAIASVWLLRSSMIIILTGIGLFLKYSIENNLIGPVARIAIGILTGISMIAIGAKMAGKKYHLIAQGLLGAGIATLYLSIFAGYKIYAIIPDAMLAFLLMSFVTFFAAILAIRLNSMLTAILGIIGGYFTPIALSTGTADFMMLFSYLLMLGIGIVAIAKYKDWKLLNAMSFIFTYALYWSALAKYYSANQFCVAMVFLSLFFLLFASIPIINNIYHAQKSNALTLVGMFLNALSFFLSAALLISDIYGRKWISLATISLAVFYSLQILFFLNRKLVDRNLLTLLTGFASFFLIITVPLLLSDKWITAVWSFQALMFLWISVRTKSNFVRLLSFIIYFLAFMRLALFDLYENFSTPIQEKYFEELMTRLVTFGSLIVSMAIGYKFLKSEKYNKIALISSENDTADLIPLNVSRSILAGIGAMLLFVYLHFEFRSFSACFYPPCKPTLFSTIWASAIVISTLLYARSKNLFLIALSAILAVGLLFKILFFDFFFWKLSITKLCFSLDLLGETILLRATNFSIITASFGWAFLLVSDKAKNAARFFAVLCLSTLFVYSSLELNTFLSYKFPLFRAGGISILWGIYALSFVLSGILKHVKALRYAGLIIFAIVIFKVFFSDLSRLSQFYRIIAFIALGLLVLAGSFVYIKFKDSFKTEKVSR